MAAPSHRRVELFFSSGSEPLYLERVVFYDQSATCSRVSIRTEPGVKSSAFGSFPWNPAVKGLCNLLINSALYPSPKINHKGAITVSGGLGHALARALESNEDWLGTVFGHDSYGAPIFKSLFKVRMDDPRSVSLSPLAFPPESIVIVMNGKVATSSDELHIILDSLARSCRNLTLLSSKPKRSVTLTKAVHDPATEVRHLWPPVLPKALETLLEKRGILAPATMSVDELIEQIKSSLRHNVVIQNLQHVEVTMLNAEGDLRVRFNFDIINAGLNHLASRTHQFWFGVAQDNVSFNANEIGGLPLKVNIIKALPHHNQINIILPRALEPLEKFSYFVEYQTRGDPSCTDNIYTLSPRTVTKLMKLTLTASYDFDLDHAYVTHETRDGFLRDDPPRILLTKEAAKQTLTWECQRPELGDLIRTYWTDKKQEMTNTDKGEATADYNQTEPAQVKLLSPPGDEPATPTSAGYT